MLLCPGSHHCLAWSVAEAFWPWGWGGAYCIFSKRLSLEFLFYFAMDRVLVFKLLWFFFFFFLVSFTLISLSSENSPWIFLRIQPPSVNRVWIGPTLPYPLSLQRGALHSPGLAFTLVMGDADYPEGFSSQTFDGTTRKEALSSYRRPYTSGM